MRISDWSSDVCSSDLMARAVHRLDRIGALLGLREEHVLLVVVPVPGLLPQADVKDLRTAHFLIAAVLVDAPHVLLDRLPASTAFRMPDHHARRLLLMMEHTQLLGGLVKIGRARAGKETDSRCRSSG